MSLTVPSNARAIWTGTHAAIPADWSRDTDFDDKFLQGDGSVGSNAGSTTHTHTAGAHTHIGNTHYHLHGNLSPSLGTTVVQSWTIVGYAGISHTHTVTNSGSTIITYQNTTVTINTVNNAPPFMRAIIIKPDDGSQDIPVDCIAFADSSKVSSNSDWLIADGNGGTEDLDERFILGMTVGGDGGGTGGNNIHGHTTVDHNHTEDTHTHTVPTVSAASTAVSAKAEISLTTICGSKHHKFRYLSVAGTNNNTTVNSLSNVSLRPAFTYLLGIQNKGGGASTPEGVILIYTSDTLLEDGWTYCNGGGDTLNLEACQICCTISPSKIGNTGGSNTHTHNETNTEHIHVENSHTHGPGRSTTSISVATGLGTTAAARTHSHIEGVVIQQQYTSQSSTFTITTDDVRYPYRTCRFIKKDFTDPTVHIKGNTDLLGNCHIL